MNLSYFNFSPCGFDQTDFSKFFGPNIYEADDIILTYLFPAQRSI